MIIIVTLSTVHANPYHPSNSDLGEKNTPDIEDVLDPSNAALSEDLPDIRFRDAVSSGAVIVGLGFVFSNQTLISDYNLENLQEENNVDNQNLAGMRLQFAASIILDNKNVSQHLIVNGNPQILFSLNDSGNIVGSYELGAMDRVHFFRGQNRRLKLGGYVGGGGVMSMQMNISDAKTSYDRTDAEGALSAGMVLKLRPKNGKISAHHIGGVILPSLKVIDFNQDQQQQVQVAAGGEIVSAIGQGGLISVQGGYLKIMKEKNEGQWLRVKVLYNLPKIKRGRRKTYRPNFYIEGSAQVVKLQNKNNGQDESLSFYPQASNGINSEFFLVLGANFLNL